MSAQLTFTRLYVPLPLGLDTVVRLLGRLTQPDTPRPLVFETRAGDDGICYLVGTSPENERRLARLLRDHLPGARTTGDITREPVLAAGRITAVTGGLPLNTGMTAATTHALYAALASRRSGEAVVLQLVLGRGHRPEMIPATVPDPTRGSLWRTVTRGTVPAPAEIRTRLKVRAEQPTISVHIRIGVTAATPARRRALVHELLGALRSLEAPGVRFDLTRDNTSRLNEVTLPRRWSLRLSPGELLPLTGWPIGDGDLPGLPALHPRLLPAPASLTSKESVFATSTAPGDTRPVGIRAEARLQHLVVAGPTGSGKSMVFAHLVLADIKAGRPCVVVDPKRQLIDFILDRIPEDHMRDVVVLDAADPHSVGFNPLDTTGRNADVVVDGILSAFKAVFTDGWGPRTEDLLHAGLLTLARSGEARGAPHTLLDLPRLLTDAAFRRTVVGAIAKDEALSAFWAGYEELSPGARANIIAAPMNKLRKYVLRKNLAAVLGQSRPKFRLRDVFQNGKTVLVPLNDALLGPGAAQLLGSLITSELWMATLERAAEKNPTERPGSIYIDEVQQFLNLPTSIADALATSRSYGVAWNLAHQFRAQLPTSMQAAFDTNARNKIVFATAAKDARDLASMAPALDREDFMALAPYEIYANLVDQGAPTGWFSARTLPPSPALGTRVAVLAANREQFGGRPTPEGAIPNPPAPNATGHRKARQL